jgi:hypothetical protein
MLGLNPNSAMADAGAGNPLQELQMRLQAPTAWMQGVVKVRAHSCSICKRSFQGWRCLDFESFHEDFSLIFE